MTRDFQEVSDEMLMALADGELDEATAARLTRMVQASPALAARFGVFAETRALLGGTWQDVPGPVPDRLVQAVLGTPAGPHEGAPEPALQSLSEPQSVRVIPFRRRLAAMPGAVLALAASVVLAVGAGGFLAGRGSAPQMVATGPEAAAQALAAVPTGGEVRLPDGATARALASYATDAGLCRLIALADTRAVVCKADEANWTVALAVAGPGAGGFMPASDTGTELVEAVLDALSASAPLDPQTEAEALRP